MAEAIIWRISDLLDDLPKDGKSWAVGGELHRLKKTVSALRSVVHDAEKRLLDDFMDQQFVVVQTPGGIREWFDDLKAALYDAEDLLEEWSTEVTRRELPGKDEKLEQVIAFFSPSNQLALGLKMTARVRRIRKRMEAIAAKGRDFDLREDVQVESGSRRRERSDPFVYEAEIIGRDGAKSAILKFLLDSGAEEKIPVLSICGVGGVGKTALARCLYKDEMVNKHFDLRIWVCLRHLCDLKMALQKITESAMNDGVDDIQLEQLQNRVMELVRGKKYLLVIDDVMSQSHEQWGRLKSLLMGGAEGSKILITTRLQSVAHSMGTTPSYFLDALSENSSLDLLMRMACEEEEETRDSIKLTIGRRIVKKCGGI